MRLLSFIWLAIALLGGYVPSDQTINLIRNGEFRGTPSFQFWFSEQGLLSTTLGGNPGGYAWLNRYGKDPDPDLNQEINGLIPGSDYTIEGDYRGGDHASVNYKFPGTIVFAIDIDSQQIAAYPLPNPVTKWTRFSTTFKATQKTHTLRFRAEINGTYGDIALDNVVLKPL